MRHRKKTKQNKTIILLTIKIMNNYDNKNDKIFTHTHTHTVLYFMHIILPSPPANSKS